MNVEGKYNKNSYQNGREVLIKSPEEISSIV
jgi:hypothetical protein